MTITHLFFDVGRVLGSGGWDTEQRAAAADRFALDAVDLGQRHQEVVGMLAHGRRYRLMTTNNELADLNVYRLRHFRLIEIFASFFSACWLGVTKPSRRIYELALGMSQANPAASVFIDDREQNLAPASALGMHTIRYASPGQLVTELAALGVVTSGQGDRRCSSR